MIDSVIKEDEKPNLIWDESDIIAGQVDYLMAEDGHTEEYAQELVYNDSDLFTYEWEYLTDELTRLMKEIRDNRSSYWYVEVENFGWNNRYGSTTFEAKTGEELLRKILPNTNCTFHIYRIDGTLALRNSHHDSPTGNEWYTITPITKKEIR